ncbi:threonine/homoserine/homoserine lactone efflux protein [Tepidamorphus gemmatus]|jgi:threonine/homoserine/homoserine lactone efflux protein|uniref:Threonine/homoserine/homoserine lactone efflux protein n=1 Tax=Tepidamorphus gemmatus TaxID=747076 RepID=A0A4R3MFY3_9HYPH|nr:LysE family translocator [Tepidamorphus gemmatus]TCT12013.1 threonine/homoserine/homoserine lactone efflux protein [Tepidamorphus gemmatus]
MDTTSLVAFALALGLAAAIPGPGIAAIVGRALGTGFRPTLPMMAGLIVGDLVYLSAAALGLGVIAASFGTVFVIIRWLGAAYLVYLAIRLWTAKPEHGVIAARTGGGPVSTFLAGLAVTLGNPKVILFYLAVLPTIVDLGGLTALAFAEMSAVVILDLVVVIGAYAALAARARRMFESAAARRRLNRLAGASMMGAAAAIAARG